MGDLPVLPARPSSEGLWLYTELHAGLVEEKASALFVTRGGTTARPAGSTDV